MGDVVPEPVREVPGGVELRVWVQPGAKRTEIAGRYGETLKVKVAAPAQEGRANAALLAFLVDKLGVTKNRLAIIHGEKSRKKLLFLQGLNRAEVEKKLGVG